MRVRLPAALWEAGRSGMVDVDVQASGTLRSLVDQLDARCPGSARKLLADDGTIQSYVGLYVNGDDVRGGDGLDTPVGERDEVIILPAISGG
jgi:molybdopterin converting factor small subunit